MAAEHEASLRQQLRRQAAAYSDHLAEVLRVQETELQDRSVVLLPLYVFLNFASRKYEHGKKVKPETSVIIVLLWYFGLYHVV